MGTKNNPSRFDCYGKAGANEQIFTLREVDPQAPYLVMMWSTIREGDPVEAKVWFDTMCSKVAGRYIAEPDTEKAVEAKEIALAMLRAQALLEGDAC